MQQLTLSGMTPASSARSTPWVPVLSTSSPVRPSAGRALVTATGGLLLPTAAAVVLSRWALEVPLPLSAGRPEDALWSLMVWAGVALAGWLGLGSVIAVGAVLPGALGSACERLEHWLTPRLLRQAVSLALGTAVATLALPAGAAHGAAITRLADEGSSPLGSAPSPTASTSGGSGPASDQRSTGNAPDPAFYPTVAPDSAGTPLSASPTGQGASPPVPVTPSERQHASEAPTPGWRPSPPVRIVETDGSRLLAPAPRDTASDTAITVLRGDTLWHIAARHLGPGATDAEIALEWPRWYTANRDVIGADADHLVPGQQLRPPTTGAHR